MSRPPFLALPPGVRARRLATTRGEFAALEAVPAGPPAGTALLLPGYTGSKEDFLALLEPLARRGFRAVAVDGRGQYESGGPAVPAAYRIGALAEDVLAQAAALRAGPVHLVGHSLGGLISRGAVLRAAAARCAPFGSLTLIGSGPGRAARAQRWKVRALSASLPALGAERVWRLWQGAAATGEIEDFLRRRWLANAAAQLRGTGRTLRHEPDRVAQLAETGVPVHVVSGERDAVWAVPLLDRMAQRLGARRTVIRGAEHSPNAERPAATAGALVDFWLRPPTPLPRPGVRAPGTATAAPRARDAAPRPPAAATP